jgi:hypothetical protein
VVAHLEKAVVITADPLMPPGPVLLVGTVVQSRWTATLAASLLREQGASQVLLLALHLQP